MAISIIRLESDLGRLTQRHKDTKARRCREGNSLFSSLFNEHNLRSGKKSSAILITAGKKKSPVFNTSYAQAQKAEIFH